MVSEHPVPLPYGLSESHRRNRTMGKVTVLPAQACSRRKAPSLQQLATTPIILPIVDICRNSRTRQPHRHKHSKLFVNPQSRQHQKERMVVTTPQSHRKKRTWAVDQRGDRSAKANPQAQTWLARRLHRKDQCGPGIRIGASKDRPIAIDDDSSESEIDEGTQKQRPMPSSQVIYSRLAGKRNSTHTFRSREGFFGHESSPTVEENVRSRAPSIYVDPPQHASYSTTMTSRNRGAVPGDFEYRSVLRGTNFDDASPPEAMAADQPEAQTQSNNDAAQDMTLSDISDFNTRKKVADLMAVAPALPVRDLYNFLSNVDGDLGIARRHVIRSSQAPSAHSIVKREGLPWIAPLREAIGMQDGEDDDEVMVKIDPNDPFLEWDSDSPPPEMTQQRKFATRARTKARTSKTKNRPNIGAKRSCPPQARNRRARGNSIEGTFVVPDHVLHLDTDTSHSDTETSDSALRGSDSDVEMANTVPEDVEDLRIDMRAKYAYNARILGKRKE